MLMTFSSQDVVAPGLPLLVNLFVLMEAWEGPSWLFRYHLNVENRLMVTKGERGGRDKLGDWD